MPDVAPGLGDRGQRGAVADAGDEEERVLHLDDDLVHPAAAEAAGGAVGEADEARGHGGAALGRLTVEVLGHGHREAVGRQDHGLGHAGHLADEAVQQPAEVAGLEAQQRRLRSLTGSVMIAPRRRDQSVSRARPARPER